MEGAAVVSLFPEFPENIKLKVDSELKDLIPPLTDVELSMLETSLKEDGLREPLVVWGDTIVDGHNRYSLCLKNKIPFHYISKNFPDKKAAIDWIIDTQLGKRSVSQMQRLYLVGKKYANEKNSWGGNRKSSGQNVHLKTVTILSTLSTLYKLNPKTIRRAADFAANIDIISKNIGIDARNGILSRSIKMSTIDIKSMVTMPKKEQKDAFAKLTTQKGYKIIPPKQKIKKTDVLTHNQRLIQRIVGDARNLVPSEEIAREISLQVLPLLNNVAPDVINIDINSALKIDNYSAEIKHLKGLIEQSGETIKVRDARIVELEGRVSARQENCSFDCSFTFERIKIETLKTVDFLIGLLAKHKAIHGIDALSLEIAYTCVSLFEWLGNHGLLDAAVGLKFNEYKDLVAAIVTTDLRKRIILLNTIFGNLAEWGHQEQCSDFLITNKGMILQEARKWFGFNYEENEIMSEAAIAYQYFVLRKRDPHKKLKDTTGFLWYLKKRFREVRKIYNFRPVQMQETEDPIEINPEDGVDTSVSDNDKTITAQKHEKYAYTELGAMVIPNTAQYPSSSKGVLNTSYMNTSDDFKVCMPSFFDNGADTRLFSGLSMLARSCSDGSVDALKRSYDCRTVEDLKAKIAKDIAVFVSKGLCIYRAECINGDRSTVIVCAKSLDDAKKYFATYGQVDDISNIPMALCA